MLQSVRAQFSRAEGVEVECLLSQNQIDMCHYLARPLESLIKCEGWLAQYHDTVTEWDTVQLCRHLGLTVWQH